MKSTPDHASEESVLKVGADKIEYKDLETLNLESPLILPPPHPQQDSRLEVLVFEINHFPRSEDFTYSELYVKPLELLYIRDLDIT